jgi:hypothetical protein
MEKNPLPLNPLSAVSSKTSQSPSPTTKPKRPLSREESLKSAQKARGVGRMEARQREFFLEAMRAEARRKRREAAFEKVRTHPRERREMRTKGTFGAYLLKRDQVLRDAGIR